MIPPCRKIDRSQRNRDQISRFFHIQTDSGAKNSGGNLFGIWPNHTSAAEKYDVAKSDLQALWPETVASIQEVLRVRRQPATPDLNHLVFLTVRGKPWVKITENANDDSIAKEFSKLLKDLLMKRPGLNFYGLRHLSRRWPRERETSQPFEPSWGMLMQVCLRRTESSFRRRDYALSLTTSESKLASDFAYVRFRAESENGLKVSPSEIAEKTLARLRVVWQPESTAKFGPRSSTVHGSVRQSSPLTTPISQFRFC